MNTNAVNRYIGKWVQENYGLVSGIDDSWYPMPPPRRKCDLCITLLRRTNADSLCSCCLRKVEAAKADKERGDHRAQREIAAAYAAQKARE